ncbi:helix-turn-helix transcriptional regulator [Nitrospirillum sp. BR 11164]|uniref:helix-turn-helix domain-containing protein n=1 Tax=Nitrospirillum sp. BR 11164 TaxID=3104324 RepID=UPI002AFE4796|nr:helix-turn-helix transcriptional regulator [Nitrospirillum sp. BR 11164]MEA1648799.1 helix-turn-helix transcriptional regulator [Nitrospirillum sp. BR 11164]
MGNRDRHGEEYRRIIYGLIACRRAQGLTQGEVAQRMGTDQSQLSKFERSERRLDVLDYVRYCQALGMAPGAFLDQLMTDLTGPKR